MVFARHVGKAASRKRKLSSVEGHIPAEYHLGRSHALAFDDFAIEQEPFDYSQQPTHLPDQLTWQMCSEWWILGVPLVLIRLIASIWHQIAGLPYLTGVEIFSGTESISNGLRDLKMPTFSFEINKHQILGDILSELGITFLVGLICRLGAGSCCWMAPVWTSWIWLTRSG